MGATGLAAAPLVEFYLTATFPAGDNPAKVIISDLDLDGHPEVVTANPDVDTVSVLRGRGFGVLGKPEAFSVGRQPWALAAGDLNGDGRPDLVTANASGWNTNGSLSVLLNQGNRQFGAASQVAVGRGPAHVILVDVNHDHQLDACVAISGGWTVTNQVAVLLGNGDGTFGEPAYFAAGPGPKWVATADFNRDTHPDLVTADYDANTVSVLLGRGDGTFQAPANWAVGPYPTSVAAGDFNGDGHPDLVGGSAGYGTAQVWLGQGNGSFTAGQWFYLVSAPQALRLGDFNEDGHLDVAAATSAAYGVSVRFGNGDGTFRYGPDFYTGGPSCWDLALGDLNADGRLDIVTDNYDSGTVGLMPGRGDGTFENTSEEKFPAGGIISSGIAGDFNGDNHEDIAIASAGSNVVSLLKGKGNGTFSTALHYSPGFGPQAVAAADFNRDGRMDLVAVGFDFSSPTGYLGAITGRVDGTFSVMPRRIIHRGARAVATADFNKDQKPDLVIAHYYDACATIMLGDGAGGFVAHSTNAAGLAPQNLWVGDFNQDGRQDFLVGNESGSGTGGGSLTIYLGLGNGAFQPRLDVPTPYSFHRLAVGDLNRDGLTDLAVAWFDESYVTVLLGQAGGAFQVWTNLFLGRGANSLAIADFNGDNHPDLAVDVYTAVNIYPGQGQGRFGEPFVFNLTGPILAAGDFNQDGRPDLALGFGSAIQMAINRTTPTLLIEPSANEIVLSWPNWTGYALESSSNLFLTATPINAPPVQLGNQNILTNAIGDTQRLYRLSRR